MDCIMELNSKGLIAGMQDIGAGGVLCAAAEMADRGKTGVKIQLNDIPVLREDIDAAWDSSFPDPGADVAGSK